MSCDRRDVDGYGWIVAVCTMGGEDLNAWLALQRWAGAYRRYSRDYVEEEDQARIPARRLGGELQDSRGRSRAQ